jgi:hypothetical protein
MKLKTFASQTNQSTEKTATHSLECELRRRPHWTVIVEQSHRAVGQREGRSESDDLPFGAAHREHGEDRADHSSDRDADAATARCRHRVQAPFIGQIDRELAATCTAEHPPCSAAAGEYSENGAAQLESDHRRRPPIPRAPE